MRMNLRMRLRSGFSLRALSAIALASVATMPWSDSHAGVPTYSVDFHAISSGGSSLHNGCFRLSGTLGQVAPGYSSGSTNSVIAGFQAAAGSSADAGVGTDEIFFNSFEGC